MLDTLMALWNRGYGGRGILVSIAFFIICISISLLLVTVEGSWLSWLHQPQRPDAARAISGTASPTATATSQTSGIQPVPSDTVTIYAPTVTPTATGPCIVQHSTAHNAPTGLVDTFNHKNGNGKDPGKPTPPALRSTPTAVISPTPVIRTTPTVGITPTTSPSPSPSPTVSPTVSPSPTVTVTATATPGGTPTPSPTATGTPNTNQTPTPTITITPTAVATSTTTPGTTPTAATSPTATATNTSQLQGNTSLNHKSGGPLPGQGNSGTDTNAHCSNSSTGDSVGNVEDTSALAILERNLWLIFGGSIFGTILFYISAYLFMRKRGVSR
jgi:hypothetical protein